MVSISVLSNTLGEQYSIKKDKGHHPFLNFINPGQLRLPNCFDDVVDKMPEMKNDFGELFCLTWNFKKLIAQMFHGIFQHI